MLKCKSFKRNKIIVFFLLHRTLSGDLSRCSRTWKEKSVSPSSVWFAWLPRTMQPSEIATSTCTSADGGASMRLTRISIARSSSAIFFCVIRLLLCATPERTMEIYVYVSFAHALGTRLRAQQEQKWKKVHKLKLIINRLIT